MSLIFLQISYQKNYNLLFNPNVKLIIGHIILLVSKEFFFYIYISIQKLKKKKKGIILSICIPNKQPCIKQLLLKFSSDRFENILYTDYGNLFVFYD